jgi:hypothetical protein
VQKNFPIVIIYFELFIFIIFSKMGKRNKFGKIGMTRKNYQSLLKTKKRLQENNNNKTRIEPESEEDQMNLSSENLEITQIADKSKLNKSKLNQSIINESKVDLHSSRMGIDKEILMNAIRNPIRHRRAITKIVLSKGQRKRLEKRNKFKRKEELVEKIKLNQSMMNTSMLNKTKHTIKQENLQEKKVEFDLKEMDKTLANLLDDIQDEEKVVLQTKNITHRSKKNLKKILSEEKAKIKKVVDNKNYQSNPLESMKNHIKNSQILAERNKKIEENFQKNYNFLNMKK